MIGMSDLPPEIISIVCGHLVPQHEHFFSGKDDLLTVGQLGHAWNAAARRLLFRDIMITFTLKDELPRKLQQWQPQAWETPEIVTLLERIPDLKGFVKSLRLRVCPFPKLSWTKDSFNSIRARLLENTKTTKDWESKRWFLTDRVFSKSVPRSMRQRQKYVSDAYKDLFLWRCGWPITTPWTQDLEPLLQSTLTQLPKLAHFETIWAEDIGRSVNGDLLAEWSISYADTLLLRTALPSVSSVGFRSWQPSKISPNLLFDGPASVSSDAQHLQNFVRLNSHLTTLAIVSPTLPCFYAPICTPDQGRMLGNWRNGLQQLQNLTSLSLSQAPEPVSKGFPLKADIHDAAYVGRLDGKLDCLLGGHLVLASLKSLTLTNWMLSAALLRRKIRPSFPALGRLRLHDIVMVTDADLPSELVWSQGLDELMQDGKITIDVQGAMICEKRNGSYWRCVAVGEETLTMLRERSAQ